MLGLEGDDDGVLKNVHFLACPLPSSGFPVPAVGRWDLNIKGEFETLPRSSIILRGPTYPPNNHNPFGYHITNPDLQP